MNDKLSAKEKAQILKELRAERAETVDRTQARLKEHQNIRKKLKAVMKNGPQTVPQIAEAAEMPTDLVLWHVVAMKKYDIVAETGKDGYYYLYALADSKEGK
jgi:predicted Rossmann fold nucleotide-binding protein DprA/Smf involved in DNA uptake